MGQEEIINDFNNLNDLNGAVDEITKKFEAVMKNNTTKYGIAITIVYAIVFSLILFIH